MTAQPRILFRTGGGKQAGLGHVRRCLSLAGALRALGAESGFLLHGDPMVREQVATEGFEAMAIEPAEDLARTIAESRKQRAGAIVVDSYALPPDYFAGLAETGAVVVAIDDLADRELPVDVVVNGAVGAEQLPYRGGAGTRYLLGPQYLLLRPQFAAEPSREIPRRVRRVLVTVGGSDPQQLTPRLARWAAETLGPVAIDVVLGPLFAAAEAPESTAQAWPAEASLLADPEDMHSLMLAADLALCGGGQTTYELAATGTPAVATRVAANQTTNLRGLAAAGALLWVGDARDADLHERIARGLTALAGDAALRARLGERGRALVDGQGASRVARCIVDLMDQRAW